MSYNEIKQLMDRARTLQAETVIINEKMDKIIRQLTDAKVGQPDIRMIDNVLRPFMVEVAYNRIHQNDANATIHNVSNTIAAMMTEITMNMTVSGDMEAAAELVSKMLRDIAGMVSDNLNVSTQGVHNASQQN